MVFPLFALLILQLLSCVGPSINIHNRDEAVPGSVLVTGRLEVTDLPDGAEKMDTDEFLRPSGQKYFTIKNLDKPDFKAAHNWPISPQKEFFYWYLPPGRYKIDKLFFTMDKPISLATLLEMPTELRVNRAVRLNFSVPENVPTVYIGSVIMSVKSQDPIMRNFEILDEIKEAEMAYNEKFKTSGVKLHKNLMTWNPPR